MELPELDEPTSLIRSLVSHLSPGICVRHSAWLCYFLRWEALFLHWLFEGFTDYHLEILLSFRRVSHQSLWLDHHVWLAIFQTFVIICRTTSTLDNFYASFQQMNYDSQLSQADYYDRNPFKSHVWPMAPSFRSSWLCGYQSSGLPFHHHISIAVWATQDQIASEALQDVSPPILLVTATEAAICVFWVHFPFVYPSSNQTVHHRLFQIQIEIQQRFDCCW